MVGAEIDPRAAAGFRQPPVQAVYSREPARRPGVSWLFSGGEGRKRGGVSVTFKN